MSGRYASYWKHSCCLCFCSIVIDVLHVFIQIKLLNFPEAQLTPFLNTRAPNWVRFVTKSIA